jgi:UDP-N-acetyl-D-galactosamine dehydrogenase
MGRHVGGEVARRVYGGGLTPRVLVLGITFKENVPDIRNSGSAGVVRELVNFGLTVDLHDPRADPDEVRAVYGFQLVAEPSGRYGAVVLTVGHSDYVAWDTETIESLLAEPGLVADVRSAWRGRKFSPSITRWCL